MSLFDKFEPLAELRADLQATAVQPFGATTEKLISATEGSVNGRRVIMAAYAALPCNAYSLAN